MTIRCIVDIQYWMGLFVGCSSEFVKDENEVYAASALLFILLATHSRPKARENTKPEQMPLEKITNTNQILTKSTPFKSGTGQGCA
jgi:hypothetical protein